LYPYSFPTRRSSDLYGSSAKVEGVAFTTQTLPNVVNWIAFAAILCSIVSVVIAGASILSARQTAEQLRGIANENTQSLSRGIADLRKENRENSAQLNGIIDQLRTQSQLDRAALASSVNEIREDLYGKIRALEQSTRQNGPPQSRRKQQR